ncbi:MAG: hypothetical protein ACFE9R_14020, partial [Candidatus Hermodarchaeota archaeon]
SRLPFQRRFFRFGSEYYSLSYFRISSDGFGQPRFYIQGPNIGFLHGRFSSYFRTQNNELLLLGSIYI